MKPKYSGIIFDLDGTLVDTLGDIAASMNKALKLHGFPELETEQYRDKVGWGVKRLAFLSLPPDAASEECAAAVAADAIVFYAETPLHYSKAYPGIPDLISVLRSKKVKTVVLSNKPDLPARKVIEGLFPPGSFDIVRGEISGRPRKPDPSCVWDILVELDLTPSEVIFAGDSDIDMQTGLSSGCFPLGVSWGYRSVEIITKAGAKQIIANPTELLDLL